VKRVTFLIRLLLAAIFLYSGFIKASASAQFAVALLPFTFVPESWRLPLSIVLPVSEIAGGALLLAPWTQRIGALLILGLCLLFIAALGWALVNDIIVSCSCFGEEQPSVAKMSLTLLRDFFLAALALIVFFAGGAPMLRTRSG
jgi:putative oxidoreductase